MMPQIPWAFICPFLCLAMVGCMGVGAVSDADPKGDSHPSAGSTEKLESSLEVGGPASASLEEHQMRKRFIWTLTQEPYFYGKYEGGDGSRAVSQGSELLPEPLPLRKPTSMHKRLYPRWYQAYVYKAPSFNNVARPTGERKRFQPFHPMARFRGLSAGGSSGGSGGYLSNYDLPLSDQPGHPVPSAPNAQPSPKFSAAAKMAEEEEQAEEDEDAVRAGELLQYLRSIASDRGLSGNTKSFRFGISKRKLAEEHKRFQPFHPMARFRGLSEEGSSGGSGGYHSNYDLPLSDQPGHPVPSAPNAQSSPKFSAAAKMAEEEEQAEEDEDAVRAGDLLQYLRSIAYDRGLSGNTKSFRFGVSKRE